MEEATRKLEGQIPMLSRVESLRRFRQRRPRAFDNSVIWSVLVLIIVGCLEIECHNVTNQQAHPLSLPDSARDMNQGRNLQENQTFIKVAARQSKQQAEEEDGFIMKTLTTHDSRALQETETTTSQTNEESLQTTTPSPDQTSLDDDRIAINATRQQFVTHDQLLNASTKDEQISIHSTSDLRNQSPPAAVSTSSRSGVPRLAFASSFLSDFLFRPRTTSSQQQAEHVQSASATTPQPSLATTNSYAQTQAPLQQQQQQQQTRPATVEQHHSTCPGVCLNLFVASLRCRNAIQAPCPSLLQKCCEVDDVSFNGTPVETSAPISTGDTYTNPTAFHADVQQNTQPLRDNEQESIQANVRPETPSVADKQIVNQHAQQAQSTAAASVQQHQQQQQVSPSVPPDSRLSTGAEAAATSSNIGEHDHGIDDQSSRSVYFLSSGIDSSDQRPEPQKASTTTAAHAKTEQYVEHMDQKRQQFQSTKSGAVTSASASDLAQSSSDIRSTASQSFDTPMTTTNTPTTSSSKPIQDRVVVIQTANGTAYLHSGQQPLVNRPIRPLYANWSDYHLLMMHSRPPANQIQQHSPVVYHSNIDPVRKYAPLGTASSNESSSATTSNITNDLTGVESESKVLKDQHSATATTSRQQQQRTGEHPTISQATSTSTPIASSTIATSTPTPITSTTKEPESVATTLEPESNTMFTASSDQSQDDGSASNLQQEVTVSPVSGIANFFGSLFDSFMSDGSNPNEARGTADSSASEQHNDRRLGLDFRQQNETYAANGQDGENLMTSDESPLVTAPADDSQHALTRCSGYCSLDQFLHLCDSHYPSSDCGRSQKCCVTAAAAGGSSSISVASQQQGIASPQANRVHAPSQVCRGTCLPVYHSSLCMKPNEIQLDSPTCLPNQVCCSHPSVMVDSNNNLEDVSGEGSDSSSFTTAARYSPTPSSTLTDGSSSKDHSLSIALMPPLPPTVSGGTGQLSLDQGVADGRHLQAGMSQLGQFSIPNQAGQGYTGPQQDSSSRISPTVRPQYQAAATTKSTNPQHQAATTSGGIMNQIFNMFKSNTGSSKQRTRQPQLQQPQPQRPVSPQHFVYEIAHPQLPQQPMAMSASNVRPSIQSLPNQQIVFPSPMQQASPLSVVAGSNAGPNAPLFIAPNGQSIIAPQSSPSSNGFQLDPSHYFADQMQLAGAMHGQVAHRPQQQQQVPGNRQQTQQPQHAHPSTIEQQRIAMFNAAANQMNYMNQQQQQQSLNKPNYQLGRPTIAHQSAQMAPAPAMSAYNPVPLQQQPPARWAHPSQSSGAQFDSKASSSNNNAQRYHPQIQPNRQQITPQQQSNQVKPNQPHITANSMSFGPADAASVIAATAGQNPHQQSLKPITSGGNSGYWQQSGWLGSSPGGLDSQYVSNTNLDQQRWRQKPTSGMSVSSENNSRPPTASVTQSNNNKAHQPEADMNTVSALTNQQSAWKKPPASQMVAQNQVSQQNNPVKPAPPQQQVQAVSLPKIIPTTTTSSTTTPPTTTFVVGSTSTTQLAPVESSNTKLFSSSSNLTPIHAPADDQSGGDTSGGDMADSPSQPHPVSNSEDVPDSSGQPPAQKVGETTVSVSSNVDAPLGASSQPSDNDPAPADDGESAASEHQQQQPPPQGDTLTEAAAQGSTAVTNGGNLISESTSSASLDYDGQSPSAILSKVSTTACGLPGPNRLSLNSVAARARWGRVMGGFDAEPGYWCWQAALMNNKNEYLCGGALIGTRWVLTAAHCVTQHLRSETQLFVRLGQTNLNSSSLSERRSAKSVLVKTSYVHHNHNGITLDNDIALLRLEDSVDLGEPGICTVCLPERNSKPLEVGRRCTVTGYGFENEQGPAALRVRQTDLPIVGDDECQRQTSKILQKPFVLPASSFCAGGEQGQDACHGDGGSPLACQFDGYYELTGIVSWGYKCGSKDLPGLYAKVSNFVGWINQIVSVNS